MSPVTVPVLICGLLTCLLVEKLRWFGYGETLPEKVREVLQQFDDQSRNQRTRQDKNPSDCPGDYRRLAGDCAGTASGRSRFDWFVGHYSGDIIDRCYR